MLELFKPLLMLKNKDNPVIFDEFGFKYSELNNPFKSNTINNFIYDNHPFIIFYDKQDNSYYYLKARGAYMRNNKTGEIKKRKQWDNEIIVLESFDDGLFKKDVYVDCSQIFKCDADLLESLVDKEHSFYINTKKMNECDIQNILYKINDCCNEIPPNLSILEVKLDYETNATYGKSLYLSNQKIDEIQEIIELKRCDISPDGDDLLRNCASFPSKDYKYANNRYNNAIEFIKMFQKEYFYDEFINTDYQKKYFEPFFDNSKINDDIDR